MGQHEIVVLTEIEEGADKLGFIQASLSKIQGLLRTSKDYLTVFKD